MNDNTNELAALFESMKKCHAGVAKSNRKVGGTLMVISNSRTGTFLPAAISCQVLAKGFLEKLNDMSITIDYARREVARYKPKEEKDEERT